MGIGALFLNTTGFNNTANGFLGLFSNTIGRYNTASGSQALQNNSTGDGNTANGAYALFGNTTGYANTANGYEALYTNSIGTFNTADGDQALFSNTTGAQNTASGFDALYSNTTGSYNTVNGMQALYSNTTGSSNTATGTYALFNNTTGGGNTAFGYDALFNTTGVANIGLGHRAGYNLTTGNYNIDLLNEGLAGESGVIRIGSVGLQTSAFVAGIYGATVSGGTAVYINSNGQLGTVTSSARFKRNIQDMGAVSDALLALRPVTFEYKKEVDPKGVPQFGLVAEEVDEVNPDLVVHDSDGKPYTVRYEAVNVMLLNEFLKEHKTVQELKKEIVLLTARLKEQESKIQRVSDQFKLKKPALRTVSSD
jgi:hypothetical protein